MASTDFGFSIAESLRKHSIFTQNRLDYQPEEVLAIIKAAKKVIIAEPTLLEIPLPVVIVGDIHGQYADLHRMFTMVGENGRSGTTKRRFLFLGDYVDRGRCSLEVICCLLVHKLAFPKMFNLLRGNHECSLINSIYGFYTEIHERFPVKEQADEIWASFNHLFDFLPLAAIVHGRILCMHGGFGETLNSLDDIRNIKRPLKDPNSNQLACDLLWADPMIDLKGFVPNTLRGISVFFGEDTVKSLCHKLKLDLVVRAHQVMLNGFGFFCKRKLITIFSAPRYYPDRNNKGAVVMVDRSLRVSLRLLAPVTQATMGLDNFREEFIRNEKEPSYITRQQAMDGTASPGLESSDSTQSNSINKSTGEEEQKKGSERKVGM